jgi:hypothetical protein
VQADLDAAAGRIYNSPSVLAQETIATAAFNPSSVWLEKPHRVLFQI